MAHPQIEETGETALLDFPIPLSVQAIARFEGERASSESALRKKIGGLDPSKLDDLVTIQSAHIAYAGQIFFSFVREALGSEIVSTHAVRIAVDEFLEALALDTWRMSPMASGLSDIDTLPHAAYFREALVSSVKASKEWQLYLKRLGKRAKDEQLPLDPEQIEKLEELERVTGQLGPDPNIVIHEVVDEHGVPGIDISFTRQDDLASEGLAAKQPESDHAPDAIKPRISNPNASRRGRPRQNDRRAGVAQMAAALPNWREDLASTYDWLQRNGVPPIGEYRTWPKWGEAKEDRHAIREITRLLQ